MKETVLHTHMLFIYVKMGAALFSCLAHATFMTHRLMIQAQALMRAESMPPCRVHLLLNPIYLKAYLSIQSNDAQYSSCVKTQNVHSIYINKIKAFIHSHQRNFMYSFRV